MNYKSVKFDCKYFRGDLPCSPNKLYGKVCENCDEYKPISKRILIIKLGALGDVLRSTPLVIYFRNKYLNCHITWITNSPEILPVSEINSILSFSFVSLLKIENYNFDIAINLDKDKEACILLSRVRSKQKYGFTWKDNHIDAATSSSVHKLLSGLFDNYSKQNTKTYQEEIFEMCDSIFSHEPYVLTFNKDLFSKWNSLRITADKKKIVGLNTGCGKRWLTRLWPFEYWVELIGLLRVNGYYPLILGGPEEHEKNTKLSEITLAYYPGIFSLEEFIAISEHCDLIVTAVSMMMHIAIGLKVPLILFNNIFNKNEFELYGRGLILEPDSGCDCYYGNTCKRMRSCMYDISPDKTLKAINNILNP